MDWLNIDYRQCGPMRVLKVGRLTVTWTVSQVYRPIGSQAAHRREAKEAARQRLVARAFDKGWTWGRHDLMRAMRRGLPG